MSKKNISFSFILSLLAHFALFLMIFLWGVFLPNLKDSIQKTEILEVSATNSLQKTAPSVSVKPLNEVSPDLNAVAPIPSEATSNAAPVQNNLQNSYFLELRKKIAAEENYPLSARKQKLVGVIEFEMELDSNGRINKLTLKSGQNQQILVEAARGAIERAAPFSPPPPGISHHFLIPIEFKIK